MAVFNNFFNASSDMVGSSNAPPLTMALLLRKRFSKFPFEVIYPLRIPTSLLFSEIPKTNGFRNYKDVKNSKHSGV